jgi:hypothetical protein
MQYLNEFDFGCALGTISAISEVLGERGHVQQNRLTMSAKEAAAYLDISEDTVVREK